MARSAGIVFVALVLSYQLCTAAAAIDAGARQENPVHNRDLLNADNAEFAPLVVFGGGCLQEGQLHLCLLASDSICHSTCACTSSAPALIQLLDLTMVRTFIV
jgi:hypothetical protein